MLLMTQAREVFQSPSFLVSSEEDTTPNTTTTATTTGTTTPMSSRQHYAGRTETKTRQVIPTKLSEACVGVATAVHVSLPECHNAKPDTPAHRTTPIGPFSLCPSQNPQPTHTHTHTHPHVVHSQTLVDTFFLFAKPIFREREG
ncbi:hypothetical protein E2C01_039115 [Portunus trituberculatus]|uniref:Uncharacterized protein n=1 Tax=Portunus trituberculatus TaxID=210409 RepID=A0A5B7FIR5_PORTR|nr:hypothetical protein [Portunus trituberculatus]